jgi:glycosyltransferase involved in cell wall biosynthesis
MVSIVVPSFKNHPALFRVMRAIEPTTPGDYEIIAVDQGRARGCVSATNQGLRAAKGDVLVMMNDDCIPADGWLGPLLAEIEAGAWLVGPDWRYARLAGHCTAMSRACYEATGGLDERFRHWCADHDLELRVADMGGVIRQAVESHVTHEYNDPNRIHHRATTHTGNWEELPNVGQWYLDDMEVYRSIWGTRTIHDLPGYGDGWE